VTERCTGELKIVDSNPDVSLLSIRVNIFPIWITNQISQWLRVQITSLAFFSDFFFGKMGQNLSHLENIFPLRANVVSPR
jgi:hypothetical protein